MKVAVWIGHARHQQQWCGAFVEGLKRHGITPEIYDDRRERPCDVAVFWGHRRHRVIEAQRTAGARYICLERGYVGNRHLRSAVGWDGLNGRADFRNAGCDGSRWRALGLTLAPWAWGDGPTVVMGQVTGDESIRDVDIVAWYQAAVAARRARGEDVIYRPHPLDRPGWQPSGIEIDTGPLEATLARAGLVVTFNSNSGVDAVLAGVPTIACDRGSMAWAVAGHELDGTPPNPRPDRETWAHELAWCQWRLEEIAAGTTWEHLNR